MSTSNSSLILRVGEGGVNELAIMVLLEETGVDGVGNSEEVLEEEVVGVVHVEVVLEVLEHVHVLLDELVASDSGEGERLVVELPGVHVHLSLLAVLEELSLDVLSVGPVSLVEGSREHVNLVVELGVGLIKVNARGLELDEVDDALIILVGDDGELVLSGLEGLDGGGSAEEGGNSELH